MGKDPIFSPGGRNGRSLGENCDILVAERLVGFVKILTCMSPTGLDINFTFFFLELSHDSGLHYLSLGPRRRPENASGIYSSGQIVTSQLYEYTVGDYK